MIQVVQQLPLIEPASSWEVPTHFPDLRSAKIIGLDLETKDPLLKTRGPGTIRKDGYIIGVSVATDDGFRGYFPTRHYGGGNLDEGMVFRWLKDQVKGEQPKVGANFIYDIEWLKTYADIEVNGALWDVQIAEPLLDEESLQGYALGRLCKKYLGTGKNEAQLNEAGKAWGLEDVKSGLWMLPARHVGPYAESDAADSLTVFQMQKRKLEEQGLWSVFLMESGLLPLLLAMRLKGVRFDEEKAAILSKEWKITQEQHMRTLEIFGGRAFDPRSGPDIARVCRENKLHFLHTENGNPSFTSPWLKTQAHEPFFKALYQWRAIAKLREDFVDGMMGFCVNGRIHCQFHPLRKDAEGTRTGRFSSTCPNLQQVPARDKTLAPLIRGLFLPDEGAEWCKLDYSQQEPRVLVHYACLRGFEGAADIKDRYIADPKMDYYKGIAEDARISRDDAKQVSLALFYGMGIALLAYNLNRSEEEATKIYNQYNERVPFVKQLSKECSLVASARGFIKTIFGRHRHFNMWEPVDRDYKTETGAYPLKTAQKMWPGRRLRRAFTHKALNALVQGSSADMTKLAMLTMWREKKVVPHLTVHDEIDQSIYTPEEGDYMKKTMENVIKLVVPIYAEKSIGPSWGLAKK